MDCLKVDKLTMKRVVILTVISLSALHAASANCLEGSSELTLSQDYLIHGNGTVTDHQTGLMWMQCSIGQIWEEEQCAGQPDTFRWHDAMNATKDISYASYTDWRMPSANELKTIVDERCSNPSINSLVFPNTMSAWYWTSSPDAAFSVNAWLIGFAEGGVANKFKGSLHPIRLVRTAP